MIASDGAVVVFAVFVLAMLVLAGFVVRFSVTLNRRSRSGAGPASDVPAAAALDDDSDQG
jgi:hypothetical protein